MDVPLKRCSACPEGQQWHPATTEFFQRHKRMKDGLASQCRACRNAKDKAYKSRPEIREHRRAHMKTYNRRPEVRERNRIRSRERYNDPEVHKQIRAYHNTYNKVYRRRLDVQEKMRIGQRVYKSRPEARENNRIWQRSYYRRSGIYEKLRARQRIYYRVSYHRPESQARIRVNGLTRISRKRAVQGTHTAAQIAEQLKRQKYHCYYAACGYSKFPKANGKYVFHIDHTYPISRVAGSDIPANDMSYLVLTCPSCNLSKGDKFPWEWIEGGKLL